MSQQKGVHVVLVGCGAIGSSLVWQLARMPEIARVTLVDPDAYGKSNLRSQFIFPCDLGELKVAVQARRLRVLNPDLEVAAIPAAIGDVPLGSLRADLVLACVDSKLARQSVNAIAWRLGIPWIDAGVLESAQLARVNVYAPAAEAVCMECAWGDEDYKSLEAEYPCGAVAGESPSDTSSALAALAASLLAIECKKLLSGDREHAAIGRQITVDARTHRLLSTTFRRNSSCRFDHVIWAIAPLRCSLQRLTVAEVLAITGSLRVAGHRFARQLVCQGCGFRLDGLRLDRPKARCPKCGARLVAPGFDALLDKLDASQPHDCLTRTLAQVGLVHSDVVSGSRQQFELRSEVM
jgi:molybdopterin/thiamine biosynthesis adenylyltransferase